MLYNIRRGRRETVRTHVSDFLMYLWLAFAATLLIVLGLMISRKMGFQPAFAVIIALYGLGTFTTGGALRFRPLVLGGATCWPLATATMWASQEQLLLLISVAVLVSYIVPGHMLRLQYRRGSTV